MTPQEYLAGMEHAKRVRADALRGALNAALAEPLRRLIERSAPDAFLRDVEGVQRGRRKDFS